MMKFKDKIVWITGASSGIGEALAVEISKYTSKIILSSRRKESLQKVKEKCKNKENIMILPLDLQAHDTIAEKTKEVIKRFGSIDILINNGGISQRALTIDTSIETDKKIMDVNYFGAIILTKSVLPYMQKQKNGIIMVTSSVTGKIGVPLRSAYAASKHALFGFFDTLRAEEWKNNIQITIFCPGYIKTNISFNALMGDGTAQNKMDKGQENGMLPETLAKKMIRAVQKGKKEVYIGGKEVFGIYIRRFCPNLFFRLIRKRKMTN